MCRRRPHRKQWRTALQTAGVAMFMLLLAACQADSASETQSANPPEARSGADAYRFLLEYSALPAHRSGTDADAQLAAWLQAQLQGFGLQVQVEGFDFNQFVPLHFALQLADGEKIATMPYWYSGRTAAAGIDAQLVDLGNGSQARFDAVDVAGKLVLLDVRLQARAVFSHLAELMQRAHVAGARGIVAVVPGPANLIVAANADSAAGLCGLPVLFVGKQDGERLRGQAGQSVRFLIDADYRSGRSANISATIAGKTADTLIIGTPINGWFTAAAERGGGVGTLLTLARHYAARYGAGGKVPDKTLVLLFTGGHEVGLLGLQRYIDTHPELISRTYAYVHLGAALAGKHQVERADGGIGELPGADPARTLYVSENPMLQALVGARRMQSDMAPLQEMPPSISNPGEQRRMYARGIPIMAISGSTLYFHTEADTPDTTSAALLEPVVQFYAGVIDDLLAADAAAVLASNARAVALARPDQKPACAVPATN